MVSKPAAHRGEAERPHEHDSEHRERVPQLIPDAGVKLRQSVRRQAPAQWVRPECAERHISESKSGRDDKEGPIHVDLTLADARRWSDSRSGARVFGQCPPRFAAEG